MIFNLTKNLYPPLNSNNIRASLEAQCIFSHRTHFLHTCIISFCRLEASWRQRLDLIYLCVTYNQMQCLEFRRCLVNVKWNSKYLGGLVFLLKGLYRKGRNTWGQWVLKGAGVDSVWEGPAGISECRGGGRMARVDPEDKCGYLTVILASQPYLNTEISLLQKHWNVYQNRICSVSLFSDYPLAFSKCWYKQLMSFWNWSIWPLHYLFLPCECLSHSMIPWKASKTLELARVVCISIWPYSASG